MEGGRATLLATETGSTESGVELSSRKLSTAAHDLQQRIPRDVQIESIILGKEEESWGYRCRCTFQLIKDEDEVFFYATRQNKKPVRITTSNWPIANRRIQEAMAQLLTEVLNSPKTDTPVIKRGLTSVSFASAWQDSAHSDCIVTLHYREPLEDAGWTSEARNVCTTLRLRQLIGRSKGRMLSARESHTSTIRDALYIRCGENDVVLLEPKQSSSYLSVFYEKPVDAFSHPNAYAMKKALAWMLERCAAIKEETQGPLHMLELYCGCGAHSVALGKTNLVDSIMAVELDERLVDACHANIVLNHLEGKVSVARGDAATWVKRCYARSATAAFNVLLVDPPRTGLAEDVIQMAKSCSFSHILYISCGHEALQRDLKKLSHCFEAIHCRQLDLFPRTDSIETLVHLQRKEASTRKMD